MTTKHVTEKFLTFYHFITHFMSDIKICISYLPRMNLQNLRTIKNIFYCLIKRNRNNKKGIKEGVYTGDRTFTYVKFLCVIDLHSKKKFFIFWFGTGACMLSSKHVA